MCRVKQEERNEKIKAGVPQGSVIGPVLYLLYTCDIPQQQDVEIATFADDTAILAVGKNNRSSKKNSKTNGEQSGK